MRKMILPLLIVAWILPFASQADCGQQGHIISVRAVDDLIGGPHKILLRNTATSTHIWHVVTNDDEMAEIATTALTSVTSVRLYGDAISCPPGGGFMGNMKRIFINP